MKAKAMHIEEGLDVRVDSWAAKLASDQQWKLYRKAQQCDDWTEAVDWAKETFNLSKAPSRSAFYQWMGAMRKRESEHRLEAMAISIAEATALGKKMPKDEILIATFKTLATEAAIKGDTKSASTYVNIASTLQTLHLKMLAYEQKEAARKKQEAVKAGVADSFRRTFLLSLAEKSGTPVEDVQKDYLRDTAYMKTLTDKMFGPNPTAPQSDTSTAK